MPPPSIDTPTAPVGARAATSSPADSARQSTLLGALGRSWWIVLFLTLLLGGAGVAAGLTRHPIYTAESQINVGRLDVETQAVPGFAVAAQNLAAAYARLAYSQQVVGVAARALGASPDVVRSRLTADPIPQSTIVRVIAQGGTERAALRVNRALTVALFGEIEQLNRGPRAQSGLIGKYRALVAQIVSVQDQLSTIKPRGSGRPSPAVRRQISALKTRQATLQFQAEAIKTTYAVAAARATQSAGAAVILTPTSAANDRLTYTERLGLIGLAAGLLIGVALAVARARRRG